ncbi:MAG TPA: cyclic nucleotide-binding domain-containing protein [Xanthobacteraceae bacterium]|nr:cyclic nucleotide-binding domain-containing protein [Xanthobacteraceae bacterium]
MALEDDIEFLDRIPTLHLLGKDALRILGISVETIRLARGDILFEEGQPAEGGFVVVNGSVVLQQAGNHTDDGSVTARRGSLIGETAMIVETVRPSTAVALESSVLFRIPRVVFVRILEGEPQAATALRRLIAVRVKRIVDDLDLVLPLFDSPEDTREDVH